MEIEQVIENLDTIYAYCGDSLDSDIGFDLRETIDAAIESLRCPAPENQSEPTCAVTGLPCCSCTPCCGNRRDDRDRLIGEKDTLEKALMYSIKKECPRLSPGTHQKMFDYCIEQARVQEDAHESTH